MDSLISVIVPVYNVEKYVEKCVRSIINQTYTKLEIILVDDGSTDASGNICDNIAKCEKRVKVIHKENGGLSDARNKGLEVAKGDFVSFIDSDDYISKEMIETLAYNIEQYNADISVCAYDMIYENKNIIIANKNMLQEYTAEQAIEVLFDKNDIGVIAWNKLYKIELFNNVKFPVGKHFEDINTIYKVISMANKIVYDPIALYHYVQRNGSINSVNFQKKAFNNHLYDMVDAVNEVCEYVKEKYPNAFKNICIGAIDYRLRVINQEIIYGIKTQKLWSDTKDMIRECQLKILGSHSISYVKKIQMYLYLYAERIYCLFIRKIKG